MLAGAFSSSVLAACDVDDLRPPENAPTPAGPAEPTVDGEDPDQLLVGEVVDDLAQVLLLVQAARRHAETRKLLLPLQQLHAAHLDVLEAAPVDPGSAEPEGVGRQYRRVLSRERALQERLADASVAALSGALARLLASMSAAVAQHLAVLPPAVEPSGGGGR